MSFFDKWIGRSSGIWTFMAPVVPGTIGGLMTGWLSSSISLINQYGAFGWWCAFMVGAISGMSIGVLYAIFKERLAVAGALKKWSQSVENVNPLDAEFHKKRLNISDFKHPVTNRITGKKFTDCELIGPSVIVFMNNISLNNVGFINCDLVPTKREFYLNTAIGIADTQIIGGSIANATIFLHPDVLDALEAAGLSTSYPVLTGNAQIDARNPRP